MSSEANGNPVRQLLHDIYDGNFDLVKAALDAGADVNGPPRMSLMTMAAIAGDSGMVALLLKRGADPNGLVNTEMPCPGWEEEKTLCTPGERALHIAARIGHVEIVSLLLKRGRADPNATDSKGRTPLLVASEYPHSPVEVVRWLLEAGADPTLADEDGRTPLQCVALTGRIDLCDMLYSREPSLSMLNQCCTKGETPLFKACAGGHELMVSLLLALGAVQGVTPNERDMCPLAVATTRGFVGVVRALVEEGGLRRAIVDATAMPRALEESIRYRHPRILRLLLQVDGEEGRAKWANSALLGRRPLHDGTGHCHPAAVSILLNAGADEMALDSGGRIPADAIGRNTQLLATHLGQPYQVNQGQKVAIQRMLLRGPAYRARSWAWPSDDGGGEEDTEDAGGGIGDSSDTGGAGPGGAGAILPAPAAPAPAAAAAVAVFVGVRIFRPKGKKSRGDLFMRFVDRYCLKG